MPGLTTSISFVDEAVDPTPRRGLMRRVRASWPFDWLDALALGGLSLVGGCLALVWLPLAGVVVGIVLIVYAFLAALPPRRTAR